MPGDQLGVEDNVRRSFRTSATTPGPESQHQNLPVCGQSSQPPRQSTPHEYLAGGRSSSPDASLKASTAPSRFPTLSNTWEWAEWGSTLYVDPVLFGDSSGTRQPLLRPRPERKVEKSSESTSPTSTVASEREHVVLPVAEQDEPPRKRVRLGLFQGTSIAGNDLIASIFYTLGFCNSVAGAYSPFSLLLVSAALYPLRNIITEIATALPFNGGTYNIMLNTTTKLLAAATGAVSILDYVATAVVSAATAMAYLTSEISYFTDEQTILPTFWLSLGVMVVIACIVFLGMRESALVATVIFTMHIVTMAVLMAAAIYRWSVIGNAQLVANWNRGAAGIEALRGVFSGFCVGLLGVTGYECAENYIEDMEPTTFGKLMGVLWWLVTVCNAPMALFSLALLPVDTPPDGLLSLLGEVAAEGHWLRIWVTVDAVVVLCAGVLTGFIGALGLLNRMAMDHLLPQVFRRRNRFTGSQHVLIVAFLALCCTLYAMAGGNITSLSGVFAISFLSVMCGFAVCNVLLKYKRGRLPRSSHVSLATALVGFLVLFAGLVGNVVINPPILLYFTLYFVVIMAFFLLMTRRVWIVKTAYWCLDQHPGLLRLPRMSEVPRAMVRLLHRMQAQPVVFFAKTDDPHLLNKAILYIVRNEVTRHLQFVHCYNPEREPPVVPPGLADACQTLDKCYPKITVDLMLVPAPFSPETVDRLSQILKVPKGLMFMSCPGNGFPWNMADFGGIRIVML